MDPGLSKLLGFATSVQGDRPVDTSVKPMDADRRKWLEEAMKSMTYDVPDRMKELIGTIRMYSNIPVQDKIDDTVAALEELQYEVERGDAANILDVLQGLDPLGRLALTPGTNPRVQTHALWVLQTAAANNPTVQAQLHTCLFVPALTDLLPTVTHPLVLKRAVLTASAVSKGHVDNMTLFLKGHGLTAAARAVVGTLPSTVHAPDTTADPTTSAPAEPATSPATPPKDTSTGGSPTDAAAATDATADAAPTATDVEAALRALLFFTATLVDPASDLPGRPPVPASLVTRPVADAVVGGLKLADSATDIALYSSSIIGHVHGSGESAGRTVALAHLKAAGAHVAAEKAVGAVAGVDAEAGDVLKKGAETIAQVTV